MIKLGFAWVCIALLSCFYSRTVVGQDLWRYKSVSISASIGLNKIQYYDDYTPTYIVASDDEAVKYAFSWAFRLDKHFHLNDQMDWGLGISHITLRERTYNTAKPSWFNFAGDDLSQGFFHFIPNLQIKFNDKRTRIDLGLRLGTANFISNSARESSNSLGSLHADIALEQGFTVRMVPKIEMYGHIIIGLSRYDLLEMDPGFITFYKYHAFQFGLSYYLGNED